MVSLTLLAVTTVPVKIKCPICGEVNDFYGYASWGSYVYSWPSKFQLVFWPHTYPTSLYSCKRCHYSAWMWDFKELKPEQVEKAREAAAAFGSVPKADKYLEIPMSVRLGLAERVYKTREKDDRFWSVFYRVAGYHLAQEKKLQEAQQARIKARDILAKLALDPKEESRKKEHLVALAAMQHFVGDDPAALDTLALAGKATYTEGENAKDYNDYLDALIKEYTEKIKAKSVPADDGREPE
jgi:hypothetical protein